MSSKKTKYTPRLIRYNYTGIYEHNDYIHCYACARSYKKKGNMHNIYQHMQQNAHLIRTCGIICTYCKKKFFEMDEYRRHSTARAECVLERRELKKDSRYHWEIEIVPSYSQEYINTLIEKAKKTKGITNPKSMFDLFTESEVHRLTLPTVILPITRAYDLEKLNNDTSINNIFLYPQNYDEKVDATTHDDE